MTNPEGTEAKVKKDEEAPQPIYRIYKNAIEYVFQDPPTEEKYSGKSALTRKNVELFKTVREMILNRDNDRGRTLAVLYLKHKKEEVRLLAQDIISKEQKYEVVDRQTIEL